MALAESDLFDPEFLAAIQSLHIQARRVARGGRHAEQRSRALGSGLEFHDFRPYVPGDDFRAIDWTIYRRLGRVFLRLFQELEDLPVYLLPDVSASMFVEQPPRARAGLRSALALAAIALNQHDSVGLFPFGDDLQIAQRPRAGKRSLLHFARSMAQLEPAGETDFGRALRRFEGLRLREGLVVVISDLFDPGGAEAVLGALRRLRHRLLIVQLVRSSDASPELEGDVQLRDCESRVAVEVSVTGSVLERYRTAYTRFQEAITGYARQRGVGLLQLDVEQEVLPQLSALFETGSYRV